MTASPDLIEQAMSFHERGQLGQAKNLYLRILSAEPGHAEAQHFLGVIRCQQGRNDEALALFDEALKARPNSPIGATPPRVVKSATLGPQVLGDCLLPHQQQLGFRSS
jgi:tetratricopeptide (TPR) repeat protein